MERMERVRRERQVERRREKEEDRRIDTWIQDPRESNMDSGINSRLTHTLLLHFN